MLLGYTNLCNENDIQQITALYLYIPKTKETCDPLVGLYFGYDAPYNASCCLETKPDEMKMLLLQVMKGFNGKPNSEVNSSLVFQEIINNKVLTLPNNTLLTAEYMCLDNKSQTTHFLDICDNRSLIGKDLVEVHLVFNIKSFWNITSSSVCSCDITSGQNKSENIDVRAVDVRLVDDTILSLFGAETRILNSSKLFWWEDGVFLSSHEEIVINLTKINPSVPPHSIWLRITGKDLTVSCSNYNLESLDFRDGAENSFSMSNSWYIIVMGIIAGVLIAVLIVIFLWRCVCRRSHANTDEYAVICTDIKALYIKRDSTTNNLSHNGDESTDTWLNSSNIYFEVEPNYEMPQSSSGNIRNFQSAEDNNQNYYLDRKDSTDVQTTSPQENVYSHLREPSNMNTMTNLYDTIHCDEYSTLQRMKPTTVIDNTYNL